MVRLDPGTTKNDQGRLYPFGAHPGLTALLEAQRAHTDEVQKRTGSIVRHVFHREGRPIVTINTASQGACTRAGVPIDSSTTSGGRPSEHWSARASARSLQ
jgi:hypothetical protein